MVVSSRFDRAFLPSEYRIDGNTCFDPEFIAPFLHPRMTEIDVGSGKRPALSLERKMALELRAIGFDISRSLVRLSFQPRRMGSCLKRCAYTFVPAISKLSHRCMCFGDSGK